MHGKHVNRGQEAGIGFVENGTLFNFRRQPLHVAVMDFHLHAARHGGQFATNAAKAQNAKLFALQGHTHELRWRPALPLPCADHAFALSGAAGCHQHQGEGAFGGREGKHFGRICHGNAARARRINGNMVKADAEGRDHLHSFRQGIDGGGVHPIPGGA